MSAWRGAWLALALLLAACVREVAPALPAAPVPAGSAITVAAEPVPRFTGDSQPPGCRDDCAWSFAGALHLTSADTSRLHGLSELEVDRDGRLTAVTDVGDLLQGRVVLDREGRLSGLVETTLTPLVGLEGEPITGKRSADAEGLATLANGDRLVSFEVDHRIWLYPARGGLPRPAPSPAADLPENGGMEALSADPERGPDAYLVGIEADGRTWECRIATGCRPGARVSLPDDLFGLVAARRLGGGRTAWLLRAYDPLRGNRIELRITDAAMKVVDRMEIARPATVDNFEGLAAVAGPDGGYRFYLISDDNFARSQRTLLMALDWWPGKK